MSEILLAEDSVDDVERVRVFLSQFGVENKLKWINDGAKAMHYLKLAAEPPGILLLDIKLPGVSGFEILDALREMPAHNKSLRVVFSNADGISTIREAYARGAHTFLTKPLEAEDFQSMIKGFPQYWMIGGSAQ